MRRLVIDAQAVVIYMAVCVLIFVIDLFTQGTAERLASPPYRYFYAKSPRSWLCLVAHVVAHKDWAHLKTNMINLLLVGPAAEREFGTQQVAIVGVVVAVASALAHMAFGHSHSGQLGGQRGGVGADPAQLAGRGVVGPRAADVPADGGLLALGRDPVHPDARRRESRRAPRGGPGRHGGRLHHPRNAAQEARPEPPRERPLRPTRSYKLRRALVGCGWAPPVLGTAVNRR